MGEKTVFGKPATDSERPLRAKRCENCVAFDEGDLPSKPPTCRAILPNLMVTNTNRGQGIAGAWVPVTKEDWCLKHEPKIN